MLSNHGWLRSPNAVASAATSRTTAPKYQTEEYHLGRPVGEPRLDFGDHPLIERWQVE
jgi:hypothetical protein